jgi:hypothetical protein
MLSLQRLGLVFDSLPLPDLPCLLNLYSAFYQAVQGGKGPKMLYPREKLAEGTLGQLLKS